MKKLLIIPCFVVGSLCAQDFDFNFEAPISTPQAEAFFSLQVPPEVVGRCNENLTDLRLLNEKGKQVPYVIQIEERLNQEQIFVEYPIVSLTHEDRKTVLILENPKKIPISNVSMFIKNADARKFARLSGSDDQLQWYTVRDRLTMQGGQSWSDVQEVKILNFPLVDYRYLKLMIYDCWVDPLNIEKVGSYDYSREEGLYLKNPDPVFMQVPDSNMNKTSLFEIKWNEDYQIDRLHFDIGGPVYFQRRAEILTKTVIEVSKSKWKSGAPKTYDEWRVVGSFPLSSASYNNIDLNKSLPKECYLRIYNDDNPELEIETLQGSQLDRQLIAFLEKNKHYKLAFGDDELKAPVYDLRYFEDKMPDEMPELTVSKFTTIGSEDRPAPKLDIEAKKILWGVLGAIILFALYFTSRMIKQVNLRETSET
jgi:hypothetical protein